VAKTHSYFSVRSTQDLPPLFYSLFIASTCLVDKIPA